MSLRFSQIPGRRERHLFRKHNNPLFPADQQQVSSGQLNESQRLDHEEIIAFIPRFRKLVVQSADLSANEDSEKILALKEKLDKSFEEVCGLADDQTETKQAIVKLIKVIMAAIILGAGNDATALKELEQEEIARNAHFSLVEYSLVADILFPESPIKAEELPATLLSSSEEALQAALEIFDASQLEQIIAEGKSLLAGLDKTPDSALQRLHMLENALANLMLTPLMNLTASTLP